MGSSGAAYAPAATTATIDNGGTPWYFEILPFSPLGGTWTAVGALADQIAGGVLKTLGTQNLNAYWDVVLAAGTYAITIISANGNDQGIITVDIDGTSVGTIDNYAGALTYSNVASLTGITVATTGKKRLRISNPTKNASSSSYWNLVQLIIVKRTA